MRVLHFLDENLVPHPDRAPQPSLHPQVDPKEGRGPVLPPLLLVQTGPEAPQRLERLALVILGPGAGVDGGEHTPGAQLHIPEHSVPNLDMWPPAMQEIYEPRNLWTLKP